MTVFSLAVNYQIGFYSGGTFNILRVKSEFLENPWNLFRFFQNFIT